MRKLKDAKGGDDGPEFLATIKSGEKLFDGDGVDKRPFGQGRQGRAAVDLSMQRVELAVKKVVEVVRGAQSWAVSLGVIGACHKEARTIDRAERPEQDSELGLAGPGRKQGF